MDEYHIRVTLKTHNGIFKPASRSEEFHFCAESKNLAMDLASANVKSQGYPREEKSIRVLSSHPVYRKENQMEGYDDIVTFGHVLAKTAFYGSDEPAESLLAYFEKPHKWDTEYQKWRELGGTLDSKCVDAFENWYDSKDDPVDEEDEEVETANAY